MRKKMKNGEEQKMEERMLMHTKNIAINEGE